MSTLEIFEASFKEFISTHILTPLSEIAIDDGASSSQEELLEKFRESLNLPMTVSTGLKPSVSLGRKKSPKKSSSPKIEQLWLSYDDYNAKFEEEFLCGYVQTRGKWKDKFCGIALDENTTVSWTKENGFEASTPEQELSAVEGKRQEMRCKLCWARDPKSGEQKRKKGRGEKLTSEQKGEIVAPTVIKGVSVPGSEAGDAGLMGFLSGNKSIFQSPTRALDPPKKVIRAKRFPGLIKNEVFSHVIPNPEHHDMAWLIRADADGQSVIGKFSSQPTPNYTYSEGYLDDLMPLTQNDEELCKEYNITYAPHPDMTEENDDMDLPIVKDSGEDTNTIQDEDMPEIPTLDVDELLNS